MPMPCCPLPQRITKRCVAVGLRYYLGSLSELMEQEGITDVLVLYSTSAFMSDTKIDRLALAK